jgi:hypothetical protein
MPACDPRRWPPLDLVGKQAPTTLAMSITEQTDRMSSLAWWGS